MTQFTYTLPSEAETERFAAALAEQIFSHGHQLLVCLEGDLGTGKTTLVRFILRALGWQQAVKSPTYTLVEQYDLDCGRFAHMDLYRLADPEELEFIGIRDLLDETDVIFVEWPEKGAGILPEADLTISLKEFAGGREIHLTSEHPEHSGLPNFTWPDLS